MLAVENFIMECSHTQAAVFAYLREMILSCSAEITERVGNKALHYYYHGSLCSINNKDEDIHLCFAGAAATRGNANSKTGEHLVFSSLKEMDYLQIMPLLQQALTSNKKQALEPQEI